MKMKVILRKIYQTDTRETKSDEYLNKLCKKKL